MQFNVAQLLKEHTGSSRRYQVDDTFEPLDGIASDHARGSIRMFRTDRGVWVTGILETTARCACSRCLRQYTHHLKLAIDEEFIPTVDVLTGAPVPPSEEDIGAFTIDAHHILDITEAVRQYAIASLPMKPLCREECRGMCFICGQNLNEGECSCPRPTADVRWSSLLQLIPRERE